MKWFKHQSDANMNAKLQEIIFDHGIEGYGLYWYCLELVAQNVTSDNLTFELEHDARIIGRNIGMPANRVEEIMKAFITNDLFSASEGRIQCLKLAQRCDDFTAKAVRRKGVKPLLNQSLGQSPTKSDKVHLEEEDRSKKIEDRKEVEDLMSDCSDDAAKVIEGMNKILGSKYRTSTKSHIQNINARLSDGHSVDDLLKVVSSKLNEWGKDPKMAQYLRPQTLFQAGKFDGYLRAAMTQPKQSVYNTENQNYGDTEL